MNRDRSSFQTALGYLIRVALAFGLLGLAIWTNRGQILEVLDRRIDFGLFGLAFGLYFSGVVLAFVRWFALVRALDLPMRLRDAMRLGFIGTLFNLVIPGAVGGDVVKGAYVCRLLPNKKAQAIASVAIDRIIGLLGLFLLACVVGAVAWGGLEPPVRRLVGVAGALSGGILFLLTIAFTPALYRGLATRLSKRKKLFHALHELAVMGAAYRQRLWVVFVAGALACVTHVLNVVAFYAVSRAMFPSVPGLAQHFLIVPLVLFSTAIPLPFGALGVSEQVSFGLFRLANYSGGAVAMMGFRVLQYAGAVFCLGVYLANLRQVRTLRQETEAADTVSTRPSERLQGTTRLDRATVPSEP